MKLINIFIILFVSLLTFSCDEEKYELNKATSEFLIAGSDFKKWSLVDPSKIVQGTLPSDYKITPSCNNDEEENGAGFFYRIYLDGTIEVEDGCGEKEFVTGTWSFNDDNSVIIIEWENSTSSWQVNELTVSKLIITTSDSQLTFIVTPL